MTLYGTTLSTPIGPLSVIADDDGLRACGFGVLTEQEARLGAGPLRAVDDLGELSAALRAYLGGDVHALDPIPAQQRGGPFQQAAWKVMRDVPPGETISYAELAARAGSPAAVRAAGSACARNLLAPVVPCHRVVRTDGGPGGYAYGIQVKEWLLAHERALVD